MVSREVSQQHQTSKWMQKQEQHRLTQTGRLEEDWPIFYLIFNYSVSAMALIYVCGTFLIKRITTQFLRRNSSFFINVGYIQMYCLQMYLLDVFFKLVPYAYN